MGTSITSFKLKEASKLKRSIAISSAIIAGSLMMPGLALAQNGTLEEIVVTAQFREENLQETPIAITAISAEEIDVRALVSTADIGYTVPNASFRPAQGAYGNTMTAFIRGIGQNDFNFAFEPGVGIYVDDVYFPTTMGSLTDLMDLERVEVLRGPQGTLFGRGSIGGAVRFVSAKPDGSDNGSISATYGEFNRTDLKASYDFTIADNVFARVSGASKSREGYQQRVDFTCVNPVGAGYGDGLAADGTTGVADGVPDVVAAGSAADNAFAIPRQIINPGAGCSLGTQGDQDQVGMRGIVRWVASDDLEITLTADYANDQGTTADTLVDVVTPAGGPFAAWSASQYQTYGVSFDDRFVPSDIYTSYATYEDPQSGLNFTPGTTLEQSGVSGKLNWALADNMTLDTVIAFREYDSYLATDADGSPLSEQLVDGYINFESLTAEVRLSGLLMDERLNYTLGGFSYQGESVASQTVSIPAFGLLLNNPPATGDYENNSLFAHAIYDLSDRSALTLGARWSEDTKIAVNNNGTVNSTEDHVDYRLGLDYQLNDEVLVYGSLATGYRPPAYNPRPFQQSQFIPVDGEEATSYELGVKGDFLDDTLRLNVAAFFIDYNQRIVGRGGSECTKTPDGTIIVQPAGTVGAVIDPNNGTGLLCNTTSLTRYVNEKGESKGVEVEATWQPTDALTFSAIYGFTNWDSNDVTATSANDAPAYVPKSNWNLSGSYQFNLGSGATVTPRVDVYGQSKICTNNASLLSCSEGYELVNVRIEYRSPNEEWRVAAGITNASDEKYFLNRFDLTAFGQMTVEGQPGRPGEGYITVSRDF